MWDSSRQFADQPRHGGRFFTFGADAEQLIEPVHIHAAGYHVGVIALAHDLRLLVFIADLANNFFDQIFDRHKASHAAVFIYHNGHTDVFLLHLAEQIAAQLALRHKVNILAHKRAHSPSASFAIRHL